MAMNKRVKVIGSLFFLFANQSYAVEGQLHGLVEISAHDRSEQKSWTAGGWGMSRFGTQSNVLNISRGVLEGRVDLSSAWSGHAVAQYVPDQNDKLGFTEAYVNYQPLSKRYQFRSRIGAFYPRMSLENPSLGWSSPYTYQYSAINAWIGEEVRTFGAEFEIKRPARRFRSKYDISFLGALYKGNDPAGTLVAWRGFTPHDRQSVINERVQFAPLYALMAPQLAHQGQYVEPFSEVDGRFGYYLGTHIGYLKKHTLRLYWYDNNGDPSVLNRNTQQYAWDTKFWSLAWRSKLSKQTQVIMQAMVGNTAMGARRGVDNDFNSWFVMLSHTWQNYRVSGRLEQSKVIDKDFWEFDPNNSDTQAVTFNIRKQLSKQWQLGVEWQYLDTRAEFRPPVGRDAQQQETLYRATAKYQF
ncbi:hypothetical protein J8L98_19800 [Pseudoalteromonas sp. MMG013]|nr:hypothetical protein [Pseudoalteromonas sp. MMG013]